MSNSKLKLLFLASFVALAGCSGATLPSGADGAEQPSIDGLPASNSDMAGLSDASQVAADLAPANQPDLAPEPTCGVDGKPCCVGTTDADGGTHRDGTCDPASACYPFSTESLCKTCGGPEQPCCTSAGTTACSDTYNYCRPIGPGYYAPTCVSCGGEGELPCGTTCQPGLTRVVDSQVEYKCTALVNCGTSGLSCCSVNGSSSAYCVVGAQCQGSGGVNHCH